MGRWKPLRWTDWCWVVEHIFQWQCHLRSSSYCSIVTSNFSRRYSWCHSWCDYLRDSFWCYKSHQPPTKRDLSCWFHSHVSRIWFSCTNCHRAVQPLSNGFTISCVIWPYLYTGRDSRAECYKVQLILPHFKPVSYFENVWMCGSASTNGLNQRHNRLAFDLGTWLKRLFCTSCQTGLHLFSWT
jgi:hypothetical protein